MFVIGKLFTYLVLPPGGIVFLLLIASVFALRKRPGISGTIAAGIILATAASLLFLSIRPGADLLLAPLERPDSYASTVPAEEAPTAIVVLGGGAVSVKYAPEYADPGDGQQSVVRRSLSLSSLARAAEGIRLYKETGLMLVFTGGSPLVGNEEAEALSARRFAVGLGVEAADVTVETESLNTWENAALLLPILQSRSVILVTSAFHMRRAAECFSANGFTVTVWPADYRAKGGPYDFWDWLPDSEELKDSVAALREYIGRFFYRIRYGSSGYRMTTQKGKI